MIENKLIIIFIKKIFKAQITILMALNSKTQCYQFKIQYKTTKKEKIEAK